MTGGPDSLAEDDPRVLEASREYLAELERGRTPNRRVYLDRYPELADVLSDCFDGIDLAQSLRPATSESSPELSGNPLGDFQIVREIGRGGMGVVYEAVQLSLGRKVALKVLPFASALDAKHLQRFKTEAYAAAQLHHTHIVPVYAVGCERGMHFYAMQLIEGRSLAEVIAELRNDEHPASPHPDSWRSSPENTVVQTGSATVADTSRTSPKTQRNRDTFRTAARIAAEVADALEYAHDAGVVHRDIKPANLLLDSKGAVWVTDFGLALVATDISLTQSGDLIGTLRYMSPEQAGDRRQPVDHRTDIYSLGATLYEMLTLQPLFPGQDRAALFHQILHEDPRPLRQIDRAIPIELETIILKALSKLPSERYATAADMAADLRRFLNEIPIQARRPQLVDRVRKWMRRHPTIVAAALILLILSSIGLSVTTAIVSREHTKAELAYQNELVRTREAEEQFKLARRAVDDMIELANEFEDQPGQEGPRRRLLEAALGYYQKLIEQRGKTSVSEVGLVAEARNRAQSILDDLTLLQADRNLFLLKHDSVMDDLGLTAEQRQQVAAIHDTFSPDKSGKWPPRDHRPGQPPGFSPGMRERILQDAKLKEVAFAKILSPQQLQRLMQIAIQRRGFDAFRDYDVARSLKLTAAQKDQIPHLIGSTFFRDLHGRPNPPDQRELEELARQTVRTILDSLEPAQREQWQKLTGKPFIGRLPMQFGPGPGPGHHFEGRKGPGPKPPPPRD